MKSDHGGSPAASRKAHACTVHAASLQYNHKELGEGDAVLSSCDSFIFGGQVEPYTYAEPDACEHVRVRYCKTLTTARLRARNVCMLCPKHCVGDAPAVSRYHQPAVCDDGCHV